MKAEQGSDGESDSSSGSEVSFASTTLSRASGNSKPAYNIKDWLSNLPECAKRGCTQKVRDSSSKFCSLHKKQMRSEPAGSGSESEASVTSTLSRVDKQRAAKLTKRRLFY